MAQDQEQIRYTAQDKPIKQILFATEKFRVPRYQRPYTWGEDQISDLWTDLQDGKGSYFLGSLVFNYESEKEDGYIDIIDGQQRIITITIFMSALRNIAQDANFDSFVDEIQTRCISFKEKRKQQTYRVLTGDTLCEYFEKYIQSGQHRIEDSVPRTKEEKAVFRNYQKLKELVLDAIQSFSDDGKEEALYQYWEKVEELKAIWIKIENEEEAYEIFESVNARGVELSVADLLKNLVFKKVRHNKQGVDAAKKSWSDLEESLAADPDITKFVRYYWLSRHAFVTEKKLFKKIKQGVTNWPGFLQELVDNAKLYNKLIDPRPEQYAEYDDGDHIYESMYGISLMRVSQCNVLFMSILRNYDKLGMNPRRAFKIIEKFTFCYSAISKQPGNKVERIYSRFAIRLQKIIDELASGKLPEKQKPKEISKFFADLENELKAITPNYEFFKENFWDVSYKNSEQSRQLITYTLDRINSTMTPTKEFQLKFSSVNIEHILPQKPDDWGLAKEQVKDYVNLLGNLTLIDEKLNSQMGNRKPEDKINVMKTSAIPITKELASKIAESGYVWNERSIRDRHENLARIAYSQIWGPSTW